MKTLAHLIMVVAGTACPAFAASGALEDNSGFLVWGFLGLCGLIVILQLVPTMLVMFGFAKGARGTKKVETPS